MVRLATDSRTTIWSSASVFGKSMHVTPAQVHSRWSGTYKVVKEMHYDPQKKDWVANWKMVRRYRPSEFGDRSN